MKSRLLSSILLVFSVFPTIALAENLTCTRDITPESKMEKFILVQDRSAYAFVVLSKSPRSEFEEKVLVQGMTCVHAKSDYRVVNCALVNKKGPALTDASLTIIRHSYHSAGSFNEMSSVAKDVVSSYYRMYFRDDREPKLIIDRRFIRDQCREATSQEVALAESMLR